MKSSLEELSEIVDREDLAYDGNPIKSLHDLVGAIEKWLEKQRKDIETERKVGNIGQFLLEAKVETYRAKDLFPSSDGLMTALTEEVGELAKALMEESKDRVYEEALQVAAMACRVATEGDPTLDEVRKQRGAEKCQ